MAQGMAFGGGSAIANRAIDAVVGPRSMQVEHVGQDGNPVDNNAVGAEPVSDMYEPPMKCSSEIEGFNQCLGDNSGDVSSCKFYFDMLSQCQAQP